MRALNVFRSSRRLLVTCLLCFGFWQFGHGAYIPAKAWIAQELMQRAWTRTRHGAQRAAPWPWADTWPVARMTARSGDIDLIVLSGGSGRTLAFGPGHVAASALPGEIGNTVIAGHRDTHFRFLQHLVPGDVIEVESGTGSKHVYEVVSLDVVDSQKGRLLLDTDAAMMSLVTCYPFNATDPGGPLRFVVTARLLE